MTNVSELRQWVRGLLLASLVAFGLAAPARAGQAVNLVIDGVTLNVSSFSWLPGNALAINGGGALAVGDQTTLEYQAILGGINTTSGSAYSAIVGSNNGDIFLVNNNTNAMTNTGLQLVITATFTEQVATLTNGGTSVTFTPVLSAPSTVNIYVQPDTNANINSSNSVNQYPGTGSSLVLSGKLTGENFTSGFNALTIPPVALNQHAGGSGDYATTKTITGSGNTSLTIAATSYTSSGSAYFSTPDISTLNFNTISAADPFRAVDPALEMFTGYAPNLGSVNGDGKDFLFQSQANNDFTVVTPEPASISMAVGALGLSGLAAYRRRKALNV